MTRGSWIFLCSVLCYIAGVLAVLLLPLLAKNTYISENALMPGSSNPSFGSSDTSDARASAVKLMTLISQEQDAQREVSRWLLEQMGDLGADCYLHPFAPAQSASTAYLTSLQHFQWSSSNLSQADPQQRYSGIAVNVVGIIRAPQGEGNEAIVLVTPFDPQYFSQDDALALGIGLALFARLSKALWIARDIIWVVADARYGAYPAVVEWLREYHEPGLNDLSMKSKISSDLMKEFLLEGQTPGRQNWLSLSDFKRAGTIATGLVFELKIIPEGALRIDLLNSVKLRSEGPNGQMPNLDLLNIINSIAVWREGLGLQLESLPRLKNCTWLNFISQILVKLSVLARQANPSWEFGAAAVAYPNTLATLLSSMFFQVIGLPTGAHGAFRDYQIDAVTLQFPVEAPVSDYQLTKFGRLLEGVTRSVNNLLEKWHQSFFLYFLSAPNKYISVSVYMQPFALLLLSLLLTAVALCFPAKEEVMMKKPVKEGSAAIKDSMSETPNSGLHKSSPGGSAAIQDPDWWQALLLVSSIHIWAFFVAVILILISETNYPAELKLLVWLVVVAASLKVSLGMPTFFTTRMSTHSSRLRPGNTQIWVAVKALTTGAASISLSVMSTVNYPVALVGALMLVPVCLGVLPLQYSWTSANRPSQNILTFIKLAIGACMITLGSPPGFAWLVWRLGGNFWTPSPANFWHFMAGLWSCRSALFPYMLVIHLPCSVLCVYILLSSYPPN